MTTVIYDISEIMEKRKGDLKKHNSNIEGEKGKIVFVNFKMKNSAGENKAVKSEKRDLNEHLSFEERVSLITSNAVASLLMSLEEDNIDSEHPLLTFKVVPEIYNILEKCVSKLIQRDDVD